MELEPRTTAPAHATGAVEFVPLADVAEDATFRLREPGDVAALAASIGRLGHLVPIELRPLPGRAPDDAGPLPGGGRLPAARRAPAARARARPRPRPRGARRRRRVGASRSRRRSSASRCGRRSSSGSGRGSPASRAAPWADELVDEALVRAPVEPEQRERVPRVPGSAGRAGGRRRPGGGAEEPDRRAAGRGLGRARLGAEAHGGRRGAARRRRARGGHPRGARRGPRAAAVRREPGSGGRVRRVGRAPGGGAADDRRSGQLRGRAAPRT